MVEFFTQNFNWPTFFLALGFFILVSNVFSFIAADINRRKANKKVALLEKRYAEMGERLQQRTKELKSMLNDGKEAK